MLRGSYDLAESLLLLVLPSKQQPTMRCSASGLAEEPKQSCSITAAQLNHLFVLLMIGFGDHRHTFTACGMSTEQHWQRMAVSPAAGQQSWCARCCNLQASDKGQEHPKAAI